jgi:hypothetical protein
MKFYRAPGLRALRRNYNTVRNTDDAARVFAHRLGRKMFGRSGICLQIKRVTTGREMFIYEARLGKRNLRGPWVRIPIVWDID